MSIKSFIAVILALIAGTALAQERLGTVDKVQGVVTVTDGTTGGTTATGKPINDGMRFVTSSSGSAVLRLNNGCVINLRPGQAVTVLRSMSCQELMAAVQPVGGVNVASGGSFTTGALATSGLFVGGLALGKALHNKHISSN
jgi:hypothetical protein